MKIEFSTAVSSALPTPPAMADSLEAAFIGEMLKIVMPDMAGGSFGGGTGESQFASFLLDHHADALAQRLDFGLTRKIGEGHA